MKISKRILRIFTAIAVMLELQKFTATCIQTRLKYTRCTTHRIIAHAIAAGIVEQCGKEGAAYVYRVRAGRVIGQ